MIIYKQIDIKGTYKSQEYMFLMLTTEVNNTAGENGVLIVKKIQRGTG